MHSQRSREGYLLIDHRASPGLPSDMAIRMGFDPRQMGEGKVLEAATLTCRHCTDTVIKNPLRTRERAHCFRCNHYICDRCAAVGVCRPFTQVIDELLDGKTPVPLLATDMRG